MQTHFNSKVRKNLVPLPPELLNLPTIEAEPWLQIDSRTDIVLEGPAFDRQGYLYVTVPREGRILKIKSKKQVTTVFNDKNIMTIGIAIHKDGRLFVACGGGELISLNSDGSNITFNTLKYNGKPQSLNDLVFDSDGYLYATDFIGTTPNPIGGVYRYSPSFTTIEPVVEHLAAPNGISLSPEGNALWVGEHNRNAVIRIQLLPDGISIPPLGVLYAYYSAGVGGGMDSNKVDTEGNLYQCVMGHGRVIVSNAHGIPIANVIIPGRDEGKLLRTSNLAFRPGTREAYLCASGEGGAWVYIFEGFAEGLPLFSHQL